MVYLTAFLMTAVVIHQAQSRPEWPSYEHQYYGSHGLYQHLLPAAVEHEHPYHGPTAVPVVLPSGHLADTPEVATAKAHHLIAVAHAKADKYYSGHGEHNYGGAYGYSGSHQGYAVPVVLPSGHLADTHEVAAAKSAHLLAVAQAKADLYYSGHGEGYGHSGSYHGYGIPLVLPNGHLADTHEVAAAKSAHMTAVAHAKAQKDHASYHHLESHHGDYEPDYHTVHLEPIYVSHHEPHYGHHVVLHSGYHGDVHELSAVHDHHLNYLAHDDHAVLLSH